MSAISPSALNNYTTMYLKSTDVTRLPRQIPPIVANQHKPNNMIYSTTGLELVVQFVKDNSVPFEVCLGGKSSLNRYLHSKGLAGSGPPMVYLSDIKPLPPLPKQMPPVVDLAAKKSMDGLNTIGERSTKIIEATTTKRIEALNTLRSQLSKADERAKKAEESSKAQPIVPMVAPKVHHINTQPSSPPIVVAAASKPVTTYRNNQNMVKHTPKVNAVA